MINFKTFLAEVFGGSNVYKWRRMSEEEYEFVTDKGSVYLTHIEYFPKSRSYEISFGALNDDYDDIDMSLTKDKSLKEALKIYNTVIDIVRKEIKPYMKSGEYVFFEPANIRTTKVYEKFSKMIAKEVGGKATKERNPHNDIVFKVTKL